MGIFVIPPESKKLIAMNNNKQYDWLGALLITSSLALFGFGLTQSGVIDVGWGVPYIGVCVAVSAVLLTLFITWQHKISKRYPNGAPLINLSLFSRHDYKITAVLCVAFAAYISTAGWMYLTTIWFQTLLHQTPLLNTLHVLPAQLMGIVACLLVPILAPRIPAPYILILGGCPTAIAHVLLAVAPLKRTWWINGSLSNLYDPFQADFVVGIGSILLSNMVNEDEQSLIGALFHTSIQLASTLGVYLCSLTQKLITDNTGSLEKGLRTAFWIMAGFSWISALIAGVALRKVGLAKKVKV